MICVHQKLIVFLFLVFVTMESAFAIDWQSLWKRPDQRAHQLLEQGDSTAAAELFDDPLWRGVSHYRAGEFEQAQEEFSTIADDAALYNQGVTAVKQGDYEGAVEKFETLVEQAPDHADGQHNLEISRELVKKQQQDNQNQQQENGDQQQNDDQQSDDQQQSKSEGDGENQQSQGDSDSEPGDAEGDDKHRGGELAADPSDASPDEQAAISEQSEADRQAQFDQQKEEQQGSGSGQPENESATEPGDKEAGQQAELHAGPSESEQATEQWLRRIPDDPSQLLRNKIKLNHMIEHSDVHDMQEPW